MKLATTAIKGGQRYVGIKSDILQERLMLIFPSWLYHSTEPNLSKEMGSRGNIIIISFNVNKYPRPQKE